MAHEQFVRLMRSFQYRQKATAQMSHDGIAKVRICDNVILNATDIKLVRQLT